MTGKRCAMAKGDRRICTAASVLLMLALLLLAVSRCSVGFAEAYARHIYPLLPATLGRAASWLPFSLSELLLLLLPALALLLLRTLRRRRVGLRRLLARLYLLCAVLLLLFTLACGLNYSRATFAATNGWQVEESSLDELEALINILIDEASAAGAQLPADADGATRLPAAVADDCRRAMTALGESYPTLDIVYPRAKRAWLSPLLSACNITGIFIPFTIEPHYNGNIPAYSLPLVICHELAHAAGYAREDEAGFIAYLACHEADDAALRYCGAASALVYALNAYAGAAPAEQYHAVCAKLPQRLRDDYAAGHAFWAQYQGKLAATSEKVNNAYLRGNAQQDGTRSYGRIVDLLLAYYRMHQMLGERA